ncbi:MAG: MBL fold metallo-hydrolase [Chitinophagales bacterium]
MNIYSIETGFFKLDGGAMFGVVPKTLWSRYHEPDKDNLCTWAMRCMLVEEGNKLILIDTGMGDKQSQKFFSHYQPHGEDSLEGSLKKYGFHPDDITDVILTHLHFDHCGGAVERNKEGKLLPTFKNATYWSNQKHWEWAVNPNQREKASFLKENILPIEESGQLKFIEAGKSPFDFMEFTLANGHTESQLIPEINYKGKTLAYCADLLPSPAHIPIPYVMGYDVRPLVTMDEKDEFLKKALEKDYVLFYEHDPKIECSTLIQTEKGIKAGEKFPFSNF